MDYGTLSASGCPASTEYAVVLRPGGASPGWCTIDMSSTCAGDHRSPDFLRLNPMGQNPEIVDPDGPGGCQIVPGERGAILVHLAE